MDSYDKLLKEARKNLPDAVFVKERFEIPKVMGHIQGNRTIISNFYQIANVLGRDVQHLLKYVLKELATQNVLLQKLH
jgi:translation initiation factor 2 subunit 2